MALNDKKYEAIHGKTSTSAKAKMKEKFDDNMHSIAVDFPDDFPELSAVIYQIGQLEEELDALRDEISANKDKATFPGIGTSGSTCLAGNTTVISSGQASAITANTAKTGISTSQAEAIGANTKKTGITLSQANAITANTAKVSLVGGTGTALSFGEMIITPPAKGSKNATYSIVMTAVSNKGVSKSVTLPLT